MRRLPLPLPRTDTSASSQFITFLSGNTTLHQTNTLDDVLMITDLLQKSAHMCLTSGQNQNNVVGHLLFRFHVDVERHNLQFKTVDLLFVVKNVRKHALTALHFFLLWLVLLTESFPLSILLSVEWIPCSFGNFTCWSIGFRPDLFSNFDHPTSVSQFHFRDSVVGLWNTASRYWTSETSEVNCLSRSRRRRTPPKQFVRFFGNCVSSIFQQDENVPETLSLHRLARTRISFILIHFVRTNGGIYNILHLKNLNSSENNPESVQILLLRRQLRRLLSSLSQRSFWEIFCVATIAVCTCTNHSASHLWETTAICNCRSWWWNAAEPYDNNVHRLPLPFFFPPSRTLGKW